MKLTGKCKADFEKWYIPKFQDINEDSNFKGSVDLCGFLGIDEIVWDNGFYDLPFSMQYGVYVDFFDSVGIYIDSFYGGGSLDKTELLFRFNVNTLETGVRGKGKTRQEARQNAIERANELYNTIKNRI